MTAKGPWFTAEELVELMPADPAEIGAPSLVAARAGDFWICGRAKIETVPATDRLALAELLGDLLSGTEGARLLSIQLSPAYVDAVVLRWQAMTGQPARLEGDGRIFAAVQADRLADVVGDNAAWD